MSETDIGHALLVLDGNDLMMFYDYQLACGDFEDTFEATVHEIMRQGFVPHGSLVVIVNKDGGKEFYQPLIRKEIPIAA